MSESRSHMELVLVAVAFAKKMIPDSLKNMVQYDSVDSIRPTKAIKNYIPDVYFWNNDTLIIGEAKTINDFERPHSTEQFIAYINECQRFVGKSTLIVSVPWQLTATAKNYFRKKRLEMDCTDVDIVVINELGLGYYI